MKPTYENKLSNQKILKSPGLSASEHSDGAKHKTAPLGFTFAKYSRLGKPSQLPIRRIHHDPRSPPCGKESSWLYVTWRRNWILSCWAMGMRGHSVHCKGLKARCVPQCASQGGTHCTNCLVTDAQVGNPQIIHRNPRLLTGSMHLCRFQRFQGDPSRHGAHPSAPEHHQQLSVYLSD